MNAVRCPVPGTYLVRDETEPIPVGKTAADVSVAVHHHNFGWVCERCGYAGATTRSECRHIAAVQERTCQNGHLDDDLKRGCWYCQVYLYGRS